MENKSIDHFKNLIVQFLENTQDQSFDLAVLGQKLRLYDRSFAHQDYGFEKLKPLVEKIPDR